MRATHRYFFFFEAESSSKSNEACAMMVSMDHIHHNQNNDDDVDGAVSEPNEPTIVVDGDDGTKVLDLRPINGGGGGGGGSSSLGPQALASVERESCTIMSRDWKTVTISIRDRLIELRFKDTAFAALLAIVSILEPPSALGDLRRKRCFLDSDGKVLPADTLLSYALTPGNTIELLGTSFLVQSTAPQSGTYSFLL